VPVPSDALRPVLDAWTDVVSEVRVKSRFLGEALDAATPTALDAPWLTLSLAEPNPLFAERLQSQARVVESELQRLTGQPLRIRITESVPEPDALPARPRTLTEASIKADRLRSLRAKDPALDTAAESLDLEIVD
jgi:hypothetical protein